MAMANNPLITVKNLSVRFPVKGSHLSVKKRYLQAVDAVGFEIAAGETLGLVGESGCGKTTTGRAILRLIECSSGQVFFEDVNIFDLPKKDMVPIRRKMQIIFQDPFASLNPRMNIQNILAEPMRYHRFIAPGEVEARVNSLLQMVRLGIEYNHHYAHELSGGQRQRVGIARALAMDPRFIVCDEPVSALDVSIQSQILNLLKEIQTELNLTYLFISHDLSVIRHISDRIAVMYMGSLCEIASNEALYKNSCHPYTQALMSAIPVSHPKEKRTRVVLSGEPPSPLNPPNGCIFHPRCPRQKGICTQVKPILERVSENGHMAACHFPG